MTHPSKSLDDEALKYAKQFTISRPYGKLVTYAYEDFLAGAAAERERSGVLVEALDQINGECFEWGCDKIAREALDKYHGKEINVLS